MQGTSVEMVLLVFRSAHLTDDAFNRYLELGVIVHPKLIREQLQALIAREELRAS